MAAGTVSALPWFWMNLGIGSAGFVSGVLFQEVKYTACKNPSRRNSDAPATPQTRENKCCIGRTCYSRCFNGYRHASLPIPLPGETKGQYEEYLDRIRRPLLGRMVCASLLGITAAAVDYGWVSLLLSVFGDGTKGDIVVAKALANLPFTCLTNNCLVALIEFPIAAAFIFNSYGTPEIPALIFLFRDILWFTFCNKENEEEGCCAGDM